jgi:hypothetical protein
MKIDRILSVYIIITFFDECHLAIDKKENFYPCMSIKRHIDDQFSNNLTETIIGHSTYIIARNHLKTNRKK